MSNVNEKIWVKIQKPGYIPQLGMQGPIPNPIQIPRATAKSLLVSGVQVYQYDPDTKKTVELTLATVFGKKNKEKDPAPTKEPEKVPDNQEPVSFSGVQTPGLASEPETENEDKKSEETPEQVSEDVKKAEGPAPTKEPEKVSEKEKEEKKSDEEPVSDNAEPAKQATTSNSKKKSTKKNSGKNTKANTTK